MAKQATFTRLESFLFGAGLTSVICADLYSRKNYENRELRHKYKINNRKHKEQIRKLELEMKKMIQDTNTITNANKDDQGCKKNTGWFSWSCSDLKQEPDSATNVVQKPVKPKKIIKTIDFGTMHKDLLDEIDYDAVTEIKNCNNIQLLKKFKNVKKLHLLCEYKTRDIPDSVTDIKFEHNISRKFLENSGKYKLPDQIETIRATSVTQAYFLSNIDELYLPKSLKMIQTGSFNGPILCYKGDTTYNEYVKNANINSVK